MPAGRRLGMSMCTHGTASFEMWTHFRRLPGAAIALECEADADCFCQTTTTTPASMVWLYMQVCIHRW